MKLGADTHPYTTRGKPQHHESFLDMKLGIGKGSIYFLLRMRLVRHFVQVSAVKGTAGKKTVPACWCSCSGKSRGGVSESPT